MPYIKDTFKADVAATGPTDTGELNYAVTLAMIDYAGRKEIRALVNRYIENCTGAEHPLRYWMINDVMGALGGAIFEFCRRCQDEKHVDFAIRVVRDVMWDFYDEVAVPYERTKIEENGDVYPKEGYNP